MMELAVKGFVENKVAMQPCNETFRPHLIAEATYGKGPMEKPSYLVAGIRERIERYPEVWRILAYLEVLPSAFVGSGVPRTIVDTT